MKKYLLFFAVLVAAMTVNAYDINYAGCYKSVKIEFQSIDENNQPITLSELVTYPLEKDCATKRQVGFFVLSSMPLTGDMDKNATGEHPLDANMLRTIATEGAMTVQVDGQGFGTSLGHPITFIINKLNARQSIDGLFAAMEYAKANGIHISDNYYTINSGYSLDGGRAIAIQRYLEKYASDEERSRFRLRRTICGGAPLSATAMKTEIAYYAKSTPALVRGFLNSYKPSTFNAYKIDDFYNPDGSIRQDIVDGTSPMGKALTKALAQEDMYLDWIPEKKITILHNTDDEVVTYRNAQLALDAWGNDKCCIMNNDFAGKKWNMSLFRTAHEVLRMAMKNNSHSQGAMAFYAGMVDGCLRDTLIADTYGQDINFFKMLSAAFDLMSNLNTEIKPNISAKLQNTKITLTSLSNCKLEGEVVGDKGDVTFTFSAIIKPEAKDSLASTLTGVDARGYLHMPLELDISAPSLQGLRAHGTVKDVYTLIENLTAIILHHKCATEEDAKKYCEALNENIDIDVSALILGIFDIKGKAIAWYSPKDDENNNTYYKIEPQLLVSGSPTPVVDLLKMANVDLDAILTIDNKTMSVAGYNVAFHVTEDNYGEVKFYADILNADNISFARADFTLTPVNLNEDGTRATFNIAFTVNVNGIPLRVSGTCSNLQDAVLAAILCYNNLSCTSKEQAQAYADAVNKNLSMSLSIKQVSDDGTYADDASYTNYGSLCAVVAQDDNGTYCVNLCLNWLGNGYLPLWSVIKQFVIK